MAGVAIGTLLIGAWSVGLSMGAEVAGRVAPASADAPAVSTPAAPAKLSSTPYCGVYSMFGALRALGKDVEFEPLLAPRYIGSKKGSSTEELKRLAADQGVHATVLSGLSHATLEAARWPMVLHVAGDGPLREYDHWVLFLGMEDGKARVVDAPDPARLVPLSTLVATWDGTAIVVSSEPLSPRAVMAADHWMLLNYLLLAATSLIGVRLLVAKLERPADPERGARGGRVRVASQGLAILAVALVLSLVEHSLSPVGFLRDSRALAYVAAGNMDAFFKKLSADEVSSLIRRGQALVIDARFAADYEGGHLPGAINVPIDSTAEARARILADVPKDRPLLVYCQSKGCKFDETMALTLSREGFQDISLYVGGWADWERSRTHAQR